MTAVRFQAIPTVDLALAIILRRLGCRSYPVQLDIKRLNRLVNDLTLFSGGYFHPAGVN